MMSFSLQSLELPAAIVELSETSGGHNQVTNMLWLWFALGDGFLHVLGWIYFLGMQIYLLCT